MKTSTTTKTTVALFLFGAGAALMASALFGNPFTPKNEGGIFTGGTNLRQQDGGCSSKTEGQGCTATDGCFGTCTFASTTGSYYCKTTKTRSGGCNTFSGDSSFKKWKVSCLRKDGKTGYSTSFEIDDDKDEKWIKENSPQYDTAKGQCYEKDIKITAQN